jgi:hypothetical protein
VRRGESVVDYNIKRHVEAATRPGLIPGPGSYIAISNAAALLLGRSKPIPGRLAQLALVYGGRGGVLGL